MQKASHAHQVAWEDLALRNDQVCVFQNSCHLSEEELDRSTNEGSETDRSSEENLGRLKLRPWRWGWSWEWKL